MASPSQSLWPKEAYTVGNAGVMLVGKSKMHADVPVALLGGRFYSRKQVYAYTDFGGGVDRKRRETPQQGAYREFVEELLGQSEDEATATASKLCTATSSALVGGRPFIHRNNYAIFIVPAEAVAEALQIRGSADESAIDLLSAAARTNSELTSVALVSITDLLSAAFSDGKVRPVSTRQLDGQDRSSEDIMLRNVMVGSSGSLCTIRDALEDFVRESGQSRTQTRAASERAVDRTASKRDPRHAEEAEHPRKGRWNRAPHIDELSGLMDTYPESMQLQRSSTAEAAASSTAQPPYKQSERRSLRKAERKLVPYIFDMETGDPDDVLTLLFLASHPDVDLRAVTITPGSQEQVALVRWLLQQLGLTNVRLGAQDWPANAGKPVNLSTSFYQQFGRSQSGAPKCERADQVLCECCDTNATLVTGAALHNLGDALKIDGFRLGRWVAQGGFAGEGVVPPEKQMEKFKGKLTCPTWNFGGNIPAAQAALASMAIERKICVSKNVCHSVVYDDAFHRALQAALKTETSEAPTGRRSVAFKMIYDSMDRYLQRNPGGKKLHDPLALATAFDESVCELAEVELFCKKGQWGSNLQSGSHTWISIAYDAAKFEQALLH
jgi:pyrimidine-specific ribonucleoside hydrolase